MNQQRVQIDREKEQTLVEAMQAGDAYIGFTLDERKRDSDFLKVHLLLPDVELPPWQRSMYIHHAPVCGALGATWSELRQYIAEGPLHEAA